MSWRRTPSEGSTASHSGTDISTATKSTKASSVSVATTIPPAEAKRRAKAVQGRWANEPFPLFESPSRTHGTRNPAMFIADDMAQQSNAALRGLNAIFLQAPYVVEAQDISDLLLLTQCWGLWVQYYDQLRRTKIFPKLGEVLQQPNLLTSQLRGELDVGPYVEQLLHYVQVTHPMVETYNHHAFQELIQELGWLLHAHFTALIAIAIGLPSACELPLAGPSAAAAAAAAAASRAGRLLQVYRSLDMQASQVMDANIVPPMLLRMRDTTFEGGNGWPHLPLVAVHTISERLSRTHAAAWRFLPCDVWGKPRELPFLGGAIERGAVSVPGIPMRSPRRTAVREPVSGAMKRTSHSHHV